jgi:CRP-like cAMP-binding protein
VIATLQHGTFVGQIALIDHGKRTASVRAATDCEGLELGSEIVNQLMSGCAPLSLAFQDQLAIAGIRQFRQAMALIAAIPPAHESVDAQRNRELGQVQAYLTDLGVTLEELDSIEYVQDGSRERRS